MRAGKLEIRVRRGIERVRARRGHRAFLANELKMDSDLFAARERGCQRAGSLALAGRLLAFLFADRSGGAGHDAHVFNLAKFGNF
jgi:hypothetical protein